MPRKCAICIHSKRLEIDRLLIQGVPLSGISLKYGVPEHSLDFHKKHHFSRQLIKSVEIREVLNSKALLEEITSLIDKTKDILKLAEKKKRLGTALGAIRELRETYKFMCTLAAYMHEEEQKPDPEPEVYNWDNLTVVEMEQFRSLLSKLQSPSNVIDVDVGKVRNPGKRFRRRDAMSEGQTDNKKDDPAREPSMDEITEKYGPRPRMSDEEFEKQERRKARMIRGSKPGHGYLPG